MCGLVGIVARRIGGFNGKHLDMFEQMLTFDTVRGKDSTGVMAVKGFGSVDVMKQAEQPFYMFKTDAWSSFRQRAIANGRILAGHNRAATRGQVTNENAHPFYEKNIVLMHNGTLSHGWETLTKEKVNVDSHAICHSVAEQGHIKTLEEVDGAFALLWYDLEAKRFFAVRNEERPLCLITTSDFYFLASESWMANVPCMREGLKVEDTHLIKEGDLLSWDLQGNLSTERVKLSQANDSYNYQKWMQRQGYSSWQDDVDDRLGENLPVKRTQVSHIHRPTQIETKDCSSTPASSKGCALTSTATTKSDSGTNKTDSEILSNLEHQQSSLKVEVEGLNKGREVLVKVHECKQLANGAIKFNGKLMEPGCEMIDATGFLPRGIPGNEWPLWMEAFIIAKVAWCTKTVCGVTVSVRDPVRTVQVMTHAGKLVPSILWRHAHINCKCRDCGHSVEDWEREWTSLKIKGVFGQTTSGTPLNTIEMICPDCIMKSLDGEFHARYSKAYYQKRLAIRNENKGPATTRPDEGSDSAVQNREPISGEPVGKNGSIIVVPGSSTLQ